MSANDARSHTLKVTRNGQLKPNALQRNALHTLLTKQHTVVTANNGSLKWDDFKFTGSLMSVSQHATHCFNTDKDQQLAFIQIVCAFILKLHQKTKFNAGSENEFIHQITLLKSTLNNPDQFIGFLSGQGGSGKSRVIQAVMNFCKNLCIALNVEFSRHTILVTALTGAAAVGINGETTSRACKLNSNSDKIKMDEVWVDEVCMLIVDEISFCSQDNLTKMNKNLNTLCDKSQHKHFFGDLPVLFSGDFSQLPPVEGTSLLAQDFNLWRDSVNTFLELRTNHRFKDDPEWGAMLQTLRNDGLSKSQVEIINQRVVTSNHELPSNMSFATHNNEDKCAINDGMFLHHVRQTHSKDFSVPPPDHTIVIMASELRMRMEQRRFVEMPDLQRNFLLTHCSDANITEQKSKKIDPMLKLWVGRKLIVNANINVENKLANGAVGTFKCLKLKNGMQDCFMINIDGHQVRCVKASDVDHLELILEGDKPSENVRRVAAKKSTARAMFPDVEDMLDNPNCKPGRRCKKIQLSQFPLNVADARTVHKLQGKSIDTLLVSNWSYTLNWIYVVLSRVKTMDGLHLRLPLDHAKMSSTETKCLRDKTNAFLEGFRQSKSPTWQLPHDGDD